MGRAVAVALLACSCGAFGAFGARALSAQEIFWDGFDEGDLCAWTNPQVTIYQEQEAFDEGGANDDLTDAEPIGRCAVVEGTIGTPWNAGTQQNPNFVPDTDFYVIDVAGPVLLRIRLERLDGTSDFLAQGLFVYTDGGYAELGQTDCDPVGGYPTVTVRQIYLPENGFAYTDPPAVGGKQVPNNNRWLINVDDGRNFDLCGLGGFTEYVGGATHTYRMTLSIDPVAGPALTFPYVEEPVQQPADGSALIYRVDGAAVSSLDLIETYVDRFVGTSGLLDTKLYVVRKSGSLLTTIAGNDDFDSVDFHFDSKLQSVALNANPHFVIVDHFGKYQSDAIDLQLTIQYLQTLWP